MNIFKIRDKIKVNLEFYTLLKYYARFRAKSTFQTQSNDAYKKIATLVSTYRKQEENPC